MKLINFEESWKKARKNIFRLESLPMYMVKYDLDNFKKFKEGKSYIGIREKRWFRLLKHAKEKKISIRRLRVIALPLSGYLKYEIDFWKSSPRYGEKIWFLLNKDYKKIIAILKIKPKDFWLFDDKELIIFHYTLKGKWIGEEVITSERTINKYKKLKQELLRHSIPINTFLKNIKNN